MKRFSGMWVKVILWMVAAGPGPCVHAQQKRPNLILIESDDQRADAGGALGSPFVKTPALDRLAAGGTVFTNFRNQGGNSGAVCVASRSMLQSGQSLWHIDDNLKDRVTLGEMLRTAGYYTYGTGKWHNGDAAVARSFTAADNITPGFLGAGHDSPFVTLAIHDGAMTRGKNLPARFSSDLIGGTAVDFIRNYKEEKPFFLFVGFNAPHDPYTPDPEWAKFYRDDKGKSTVPAPPAFLTNHPFDPGTLDIRDEVLLPRPLVPGDLAEQNAIYYGMVSHLDHWVGLILDQLKARGIDGDTIVLFTSDHGLARGSNGLLGKQNLYEHTLKVPFLAMGPGIPAGKRSGAALYNYEIYRTLADYAGAAVPARQGEGVSFRPILEGREPGDRGVTYHGYTHLMRALVEKDWKLIEYHVKDARHTQLFNIGTDPHEERDLSGDPSQKERIDHLRKRLFEERDRYDDGSNVFWKGF